MKLYEFRAVCVPRAGMRLRKYASFKRIQAGGCVRLNVCKLKRYASSEGVED